MPNTMPLGRSAESDDLIWIWDSSVAALRQCKISDLPFGAGGGSSGPLLGSPFKIRLGDPEVEVVTVSPGVYNTVVTDLRLVGKTDYPVSCTQLNNASFRDGDLIFDSVNGKVTIKNFILISGEILILYPDGVPGSSGGSTALLQDQIDELKLMLAPLLPDISGKSGASFWWTRAIEDIPAGWVIDESMKGYVPVQFDASIDEIKEPGLTGGSASHVNTEDEMFPHEHKMFSSDVRSGPNGTEIITSDKYVARGAAYKGQEGYELSYSSLEPTLGRSGLSGGYLADGATVKTAKPYSIRNPFKTGCWIKYISA
ncbi:hypothetical protein [Pedobacter punctiformis]|uniref:Uncharacterized protein n=1 Tax=Pedobacter punctiformis TaxID=3004097 RepID=A0ABT4LAQ1_9SPHI|nr:hypothetical protein [Pedobacter sp. HCMS5-2]MCZ4244985.1 hypothetical protein [Pedobacter sp. HCMS5-2]